jgi:hypothetical protein
MKKEPSTAYAELGNLSKQTLARLKKPTLPNDEPLPLHPSERTPEQKARGLASLKAMKDFLSQKNTTL